MLLLGFLKALMPQYPTRRHQGYGSGEEGKDMEIERWRERQGLKERKEKNRVRDRQIDELIHK